MLFFFYLILYFVITVAENGLEGRNALNIIAELK